MKKVALLTLASMLAGCQTEEEKQDAATAACEELFSKQADNFRAAGLRTIIDQQDAILIRRHYSAQDKYDERPRERKYFCTFSKDNGEVTQLYSNGDPDGPQLVHMNQARFDAHQKWLEEKRSTTTVR